MTIWPQQAAFLLKLGVCILPVLVGCYIAETAADRRGMGGARKLYSRLAGLCLIVACVCFIAGLLVWAMS